MTIVLTAKILVSRRRLVIFERFGGFEFYVWIPFTIDPYVIARTTPAESQYQKYIFCIKPVLKI